MQELEFGVESGGSPTLYVLYKIQRHSEQEFRGEGPCIDLL